MCAKRILYIEDNFQNRRLVKKILGAEGYEFLEAEDAASGIELALKERPDLILMDINMAGMDGMEATAVLKKSEAARIPVIALTAVAMKGDRERILAAGCDDYMQKPINRSALVDIVTRYAGPSGGTIIRHAHATTASLAAD
jgi:two-component system cell cycle response regulator DivK